MGAKTNLADYTAAPWRELPGWRVLSTSFDANCRKWSRAAEKEGKRRRVLVGVDPFAEWGGPIVESHVEGCWRTDLSASDVVRDLFATIDACPWLDFLLRTHRPWSVRGYWPEHKSYLVRNRKDYRRNVWLLTSVADQEDADANIPELLKCRGLVPVLGVSAEPLLGPVDFTRIPTGHWAYGKVDVMSGYLCGSEPDEMRDYESDPSGATRKQPGEWERGKFGLDVVIVGGESGPDARPMHPDWVRSIRDQCQAAGVAFFFKQWGEWCPAHVNGQGEAETESSLVSPRGDDDRDYHDATAMIRVGKKAAGRLLDGREWNELPEVSHA